MNFYLFILIGIVAGTIIVPALVYFAGFSQASAVGTSLAILLPPIGLAAAFEYYRHGHINVKAAMIIATIMILTSWISSRFALKINSFNLKIIFSSFIIIVGIYIIITSIKK